MLQTGRGAEQGSRHAGTREGFPQTPGSLRGSDWNSKLWPSPGAGSAGTSINARAGPERSQRARQDAPAGSVPVSNSRRITARSAITAASLLLLSLLILAAAMSGNLRSALGRSAASSPWVHHAAENTNTSHVLGGSECDSIAAGAPGSNKALVRTRCVVRFEDVARVLTRCVVRFEDVARVLTSFT